jgi:hypothetical protein
MQIECLCNPAAAECITSYRWDASGADTAATADSAVVSSDVSSEHRQGIQSELRASLRCSVFHGATSDGAQLMHQLNLLGAPSREEAAALTRNASPACSRLFAALLSEVEKKAGAASARSVGLHESKAMQRQSCTMQPDGSDADGLAALVEEAPHTASCIAMPAKPLSSSLLVPSQVPEPLDFIDFFAHRYVPIDIAHLLARVLTWDPAQRLSAAHMLLHPALIAPGRSLEEGVLPPTSASAPWRMKVPTCINTCTPCGPDADAGTERDIVQLLQMRAQPLSPVYRGAAGSNL